MTRKRGSETADSSSNGHHLSVFRAEIEIQREGGGSDTTMHTWRERNRRDYFRDMVAASYQPRGHIAAAMTDAATTALEEERGSPRIRPCAHEHITVERTDRDIYTTMHTNTTLARARVRSCVREMLPSYANLASNRASATDSLGCRVPPRRSRLRPKFH